MVDFFEETVSLGAAPKEVSNWMLDDLLRVLKEKGVELKSMGFTPDNLAKLLCLLRGTKSTGIRRERCFRRSLRTTPM